MPPVDWSPTFTFSVICDATGQEVFYLCVCEQTANMATFDPVV